MNLALHDADFWNSQTDYQAMAHGFTALFARDAWDTAGVPAGAKVLDIAAGAGALALIANEAGAEVVATDFSTGLIEALRAHHRPWLRAEVMDGQALTFADRSFDAAFSMFGIMLFADWRAGLAEMARVVRPAGTGCIGTWEAPAGAAANLLLDQITAALFPNVERGEGPAGMLAWRTPERLTAVLEDVGFGDVTVTRVSHVFPIDAAAIAAPERLFQFSPIWPVLSDKQQQVVVGTIEAAIATHDGPLPVPSPALIGVGRRR